MSTMKLWSVLRHALGNYPTTAHEWAIRVRSQDVTRRELLALDDWLRADPRNADEYARVAKIGHLGLLLRELPEARSKLRRMPAPAADERRTSGRFLRSWSTAAAAFAVITLAGVMWFQYSPSTPDRYASDRGEQRQVSLPDGSRMVVNTDSEATVRFTGSERAIQLVRGEAFFDVAKDAARPFVVRTATAEVRAVGTKFSVRYESTDTRVIVSEGRVKVVPQTPAGPIPTAEVEVASGVKAMVAEAAPARLTAVDAIRAVAWTSGNVEFEDAPLADVLADVNRYTRKPFVIADPSLLDIRLTGRFRTGDAEAVKFVLAGRFDVLATEDLYGIRLTRR